eukprot:5998056-Alexandrium_andersonii.AAC.1
MQGPAVLTTAAGTRTSASSNNGFAINAAGHGEGPRGHRQNNGALHVRRVLGTRAVGAELHVLAAQLHA